MPIDKGFQDFYVKVNDSFNLGFWWPLFTDKTLEPFHIAIQNTP